MASADYFNVAAYLRTPSSAPGEAFRDRTEWETVSLQIMDFSESLYVRLVHLYVSPRHYPGWRWDHPSGGSFSPCTIGKLFATASGQRMTALIRNKIQDEFQYVRGICGPSRISICGQCRPLSKILYKGFWSNEGLHRATHGLFPLTGRKY